MESVFLSKSFSLYLRNFKAAVIFALLLVSVVFFSSFSNIFVSSGTIFLAYSLSLPEIGLLLSQLLGVIAFLLFYSFFVTVIVFSVRKELSAVKLSYYITEAIKKFSFKLFGFFVFFALALYLLQLIFISLSLPAWLSALVMLVLAAAFLFVPQAIVVDEQGLLHSLQENFEFISKHPKTLALVLIVGAVLLAALQIIEFQADKAFLLGNYFSLFIAMLFVQPFLEVMKTYFYIVDKFSLIREHELKTK